MKDDMVFDSILSNTGERMEKTENAPKKEKSEKIQMPYFLKSKISDSGGERIADSREEGIVDGCGERIVDGDKLKSDDTQKDHDIRKKALLNAISALNSEYFKLNKIQFGILRENVALQYRIFKIDMEYSSEFDEFVAGLIGKKTAPLARKIQDKEREYGAIEEKLKKIDGRLSELLAKLEAMKNAG